MIWKYYVRWSLAAMPGLQPERLFRQSTTGIAELWNPETKFWDAVPGDWWSRAIENGDNTVDRIAESLADELKAKL